MNKIRRIIPQLMANKYRILSFLLAVVLLIATVNLATFLPVNADGTDDTIEVDGEKLTVRYDALHFIFRHWHTDYDPETRYQDEKAQSDGNNWFVLTEGYILPNKNPTNDNNYDIYMVDQNSGELKRVSIIQGNDDSKSAYIRSFNKKTGELILNVKPLREKNPYTNTYDYLEKFCGVSLSAGRGAATYVKEDEQGNPTENTSAIKITYSYNTHLVKGHVFYSSWAKTVPGSTDSALFNYDNQIDTAEVYTWKANQKGHNEGDIVKYSENGSDVVCKTEEDLAKVEDLTAPYEEHVTLTKFYSTADGMHTNKTIVESADGRIFLFDLEAWYVEGYSAQLGYVIDSSGSMAFAAEVPSIVNVYEVLMERLDIKADGKGNYVYTNLEGGKYSVKASNPADLLARNSSGKSKFEDKVPVGDILETLSDKIGYEFTQSNWETLFKKIGAVNNLSQDNYKAYPALDSLIGYYEMRQYNPGNNSTSRTWYLNSIDADGKYRAPSASIYSSVSNDDFAKMVVHSSQNGTLFNFDFSEAQQKTLMNLDGSGYGGWGDVPINFSDGTGLNLRHSDAAFIPNAMPTSNKFTLSFTLQNTALDKDIFKQKIEILYVGPKSGNTGDNNFFRLTREDGNLVFYNGYHGATPLYTMQNVFGTSAELLDTGKRTVTLTFDDDGNGKTKVSIYLDGAKINVIENLTLNEYNVVFSPFKDYYEEGTGNESAKFFLDDIFIYDTPLYGSQMMQLVDSHAANKGITETYNGYDWNSIFLENAVLDLLLNPRNTAHVPLGVAAYSYFIYNADSGTQEYGPIAYWDGGLTVNGGSTGARSQGNILGSPTNYNQGSAAGWYYLSHAGSIDDNLGTAKTLIGLGANSAKDIVDLPGFALDDLKNDTGNQYTSQGNITIPFYIDEGGNLRCFYTSSRSTTASVACSYVYELSDNDYVKTETLQRILANFSTKISEYSPSSRISAVKFSSNVSSDTDLDKLVLLDWSNDPDEIAAIMSQKRGNGSATDSETSANGVEQYNYALTGSTSTWTGLKSFFDNIVTDGKVKISSYNKSSGTVTFDCSDDELTKHRRDDVNAPKFVIVFTDGADTDRDGANKDEAEKYAAALKALNYTVVCAYLPGGATPYDDEGNLMEWNGDVQTDYGKAKAFLSTLASTDGSGNPYVFTSTDVSAIEELFETQILDSISEALEGYTVQDYIDPRFDLENSEGLWHLNGGGIVEIVNGEKVTRYDLKSSEYLKEGKVFRLVGEATPEARDARLFYDANSDMYYLKWVNQTITTTPVGSNDLVPVWTAEVILVAKEDFIGGNAVLTNGNEEKMNYVFHPADLDASSGTDDTTKGEGDNYVSKGFPRVTVNVQLQTIYSNNIDNPLFLGEVVSPAQLLADMDDDYVTSSYHLDYLKRYAYQRYLFCLNYTEENVTQYNLTLSEVGDLMKKIKTQMNMPLLDLLHEWLQLGNSEVAEKAFSIPYMYLPSVEYDSDGAIAVKNNQSVVLNSVGTKAHQQEVFGVLTYRWVRIDDGQNTTIEADHVKQDLLGTQYKLTIEYTPLRTGDSLTELNKLADNEQIFAKYIPIEVTLETWDDWENAKITYDREEYVNNALINECDVDCVCNDGSCLGHTDCDCNCSGVYKWNSSYKPAAYDEQISKDANYGQYNQDGELNPRVSLINNNRTLSVSSTYSQSVVSGGITLELALTEQELKKAIGESDELNVTFTLEATRYFTDTAFAERIKAGEFNQGVQLSDYSHYVEDVNSDSDVVVTDDGKYVFSFTFAYDSVQTAALLAKANGGTVSIFPTSASVWEKNNKNDGSTSSDDHDLLTKGLPIGTYVFDLADIKVANADGSENESMNSLLTLLTSLTAGSDTDIDNFNSVVGKGGSDGSDGNNKIPGLQSDRMGDFAAPSVAVGTNLTFYIGTSDNNHRGNSQYTDSRYGIIKLAQGAYMTKLTIKENGGNSNESFLYHIEGTGVDGTKVDLTVSVKGGSSTTVIVIIGQYMVTEISSWAWKYDTESVVSTLGDWTIDKNNVASTDISGDGAIVTYNHKSNNKGWLGGESSNNFFKAA